MKLSLYNDDWMLTMGLIGLYRIYEFGEKEKLIPENLIQMTDFGLEFDSEVLTHLPSLFFHYFIAQYSVAKRDQTYLQEEISRCFKADRFKTSSANIRTRINDRHKKISKYFEDTKEYLQLTQNIEALKEIKSAEEMDKLQQLVNEYVDILQTEFINDKLTMNYFKASILSPYFGQPSFLNVAKNSLDKAGHIAGFYDDYVFPVLLETKLLDCLDTAQSTQEVLAFLEENKDHYQPFKGFIRDLKKKGDFSEVKSYFEQEVSECSLINNQLGTNNFEEMIFSPLGLSKKNALNFNWNLNNSQPIPISSLAKLILFLIPAGAAIYSRKDGFAEQGENRLYAGFIFSDDRFEQIYQQNNDYRQKKENKDPFDQVVFDILRDTQEKAKLRQNKNFILLECHADYQSKKTLLDYYHIPSYLVNYFQGDKNPFVSIYSYEYREAFIRAILKGIDTKQIIFRYLRSLIEKGSSAYSALVAIQERYKLRMLKAKGERVLTRDEMTSLRNRVYVVYKQGKMIRESLTTAQQKRADEAQGGYVASDKKKIASIAYRLLNAAKAGDERSFMDTVFRLHISAEKNVPQIFLNAYHENVLDFETVAGAFIAGLLSDDLTESKETKQEGVS